MSFLRPIDSRPTLLCSAGNERKCQGRLRLFAENFARHRNEQGLCRRKAEAPNPNAQAPGKHQPSNVHKIGKCVRLCFDFWDLEPGIWDFGACAALARLVDVITSRL